MCHLYAKIAASHLHGTHSFISERKQASRILQSLAPGLGHLGEAQFSSLGPCLQKYGSKTSYLPIKWQRALEEKEDGKCHSNMCVDRVEKEAKQRGANSSLVSWTRRGKTPLRRHSQPQDSQLEVRVLLEVCFCPWGPALGPYPPQTWFCLGEGLPCLLSSTKLVLLSGGSSSLTTSKMDSVKQLFWRMHWVSHPILVGPGVQTCSFPLGLVFQNLCLARIIFSSATQWCTNLSHLSSHSHGLVTTGKMSDSMRPFKACIWTRAEVYYLTSALWLYSASLG